MILRKQIGCIGILAVLLFSACQKIDDLSNAEIESKGAEFAIPLFSASTTIEDLIEGFDENTFIEIDGEGVVHLRYKGDVLTQTANEFLQAASDSIPPAIPLTDTLFALPFSSPQQLKVDKAIYKTGTVRFGVKSDYVGTIDFKLSILHAQKDGQVATLEESFSSPPPVQGYYASQGFLDMSGYELLPQNDTVLIRYEAYTDAGDRIELPQVFLISEDVYFSYIEGVLGNFTHNGRADTIFIDFFENWIQGEVFFENPDIFIHVQNSFGVPTRSDIKVFDIITADDQRLPLESTFITDTGIDFVYPSLNEVGQVKEMTFAFDENNSNIEDVLGSKPVALEYDVDALMNPDNNSTERGFITDSSYYNIQVEVDLPLRGQASGFTMRDTFSVDFSSYDEVTEAEFKMVADNGMPLEIIAQAWFLDAQGQVLDSLFAEGPKTVVEAAPVDANGIATQTTQATHFITFDQQRFDKLRATSKVALSGAFSTTGNGTQTVKAIAGQGAEIRMGMKLKE
jgi:hypothetical protein